MHYIHLEGEPEYIRLNEIKQASKLKKHFANGFLTPFFTTTEETI